jgi:hypothetical protein
MLRLDCMLLATAVLAGCASEPPSIGERTQLEPGLWSATWSADGASIALGTTWIIDAKSGRPRRMNIKDRAQPVGYSRDGSLLFGTFGFYTRAWELNSGSVAWQAAVRDGKFACSALSAIVVATPRQVVLLDPASGKERASLEAEPFAGPQVVGCSPDGRFLSRAYGEGVASVWDVAARRRLGLVRVRDGEEPFRVALAPGAEWLAAWVGGRLLLFARTTWASAKEVYPPDVSQPNESIEVQLRPAQTNVVARGLEVSPDGRHVALAGISGGGRFVPSYGIALANLDTKRVERLPPETGLDVAFSPDGTRLALCGPRGIQLWDVGAGALVKYPKP